MVKGAIAILDLPIGSALSIDGCSMVLKRADFVGVSEVPSDGFHLVTARRGGGAAPSMILHGFVIYGEEQNWILARKYNPKTEEVSTAQLDELGTSNLQQKIASNQIDDQRIVSYHKIITDEQWKEATTYISASLIQKRGFRSGDKIMPGAYVGYDDVSEQASDVNVDGSSITYPPIPCLDPSVSLHKAKHQGTRQFLSRISPTDRSALFMAEYPANQALESLLNKEYNNEWDDLLGDLQLAFILFIHLHCFASLEHWRDLIVMLSLVQADGISERPNQYASLLEVLRQQLLSVEPDFFEDIDYTETFLFPAVKRLCILCNTTGNAALEKNASKSFMRMVRQRFGSAFAPENNDGDDYIMDLGESKDTPVVITLDEVESSISRYESSAVMYSGKEQHSDAHKRRYPLLFAAVQSHEDLMMTCARVLDEKVDVSLVREVAAYLEEVEANK